MKAKAWLCGVLLSLPAVAFAWPWSQDMMNQPSIKPQEGVPMEFPKRSVPATGIPTDLSKIADREQAKPLTSPIPVADNTLKKGKHLFQIYCAACHGMTGKADAPISPKIGAISLVDDYVQKELTDGWIWGTITFGSAIMPAYGKPTAREDKRGANDLTPEERWLVVNYVKHQLAKDAQAEGVTASAP